MFNHTVIIAFKSKKIQQRCVTMYLYVSQTLEKQWLSLLVGHKEFAVESVLTLLGRKFDVNISFIKKKMDGGK